MHHRILAFVSLFSLLALLAMALPAETLISHHSGPVS